MLSSLAEYKIPSMLSVTNLISLSIIITSLGIAKQTQKLILLDVKTVNSGLHFFLFTLFSFSFSFLFFSIFRTTQVRVYQSHCHISHKLMAKSQDLGKESRRFWNKVTSYNIDNTCWSHVIHMVIRVGCTVVSTDHE